MDVSPSWDEILANQHEWIGGSLHVQGAFEPTYAIRSLSWRGYMLLIEYGLPDQKSKWITGEEWEFRIMGWRRPKFDELGSVIHSGGVLVSVGGHYVLLSKKPFQPLDKITEEE